MKTRVPCAGAISEHDADHALPCDCRLQNGRFDSPDRLFGSVREAWESVTGNAADFKELIPEFFLPSSGAYLVNRHKLALGTRQDG